MHIFHIQVVSGHSIGNGILGKDMWLFDGIPRVIRIISIKFIAFITDLRCHQFGVKFDGVVT